MHLNWKELKKPIIALSPMADMTDSAFCRTTKSILNNEYKNSLIVFREMVSAEAVVRNNQKTLEMTDIHKDERPLVQQIFGSDPQTMASATQMIDEQHNPEGFDINMGCPVYKLVCNFNGASLMKEPIRASEIVKAMKSVTKKSVSVKIRLGWEKKDECFEFIKHLEQAGVDLVTVHGRTKIQGYTGESDWEMISKLKEQTTIPLLANGDIFTSNLAVQALLQTRCDGILIARGALGNPWIFQQLFDLLNHKQPKTISIQQRIDVIKQHLDFHIEQYGEKGVTTFRKHLTWYLKGLDHTKSYKERLHTTNSKTDLKNILDEMILDEYLQQSISTRDANHQDSSSRMRMTK